MGQRTPCLKRLGKTLANALLVVAMLASNAGTPRAQDGETAEEVFRDHVSGAVIQSRCVNCHAEGGVSGHTRLVFVRSSDTADHETLNLQAFQDFLAAVEDEGGGGYILNKIQGVSHGGGVQVALGSADFANMERFPESVGRRGGVCGADAGDAVRDGGAGIEPQDAAAGGVDLCGPHPDG